MDQPNPSYRFPVPLVQRPPRRSAPRSVDLHVLSEKLCHGKDELLTHFAFWLERAPHKGTVKDKCTLSAACYTTCLKGDIHLRAHETPAILIQLKHF